MSKNRRVDDIIDSRTTAEVLRETLAIVRFTVEEVVFAVNVNMDGSKAKEQFIADVAAKYLVSNQPEPDLCTYCGETTHHDLDCPERKRKENEDAHR